MDPMEGPAGYLVIGLLQSLAFAWFARRSGLWRWVFDRSGGDLQRKRLLLAAGAYLFLMTPVVVAAMAAG